MAAAAVVNKRRLTVSRRNYVLGLALGAALWVGSVALSARTPGRAIEGRIVGSSIEIGHRLAANLSPRLGAPAASRTDAPRFPPVVRSERVSVVIVGGGIAGLTAGWRLLKSGLSDFALLELEASAGGNAKGATMDVRGAAGAETVAHPWAAHYLPLPAPDNTLLIELLAEASAARADRGGGARAGFGGGARAWDESLLCPLPVERLFAPGGRAGQPGEWLECPEGLLPSHLLADADHAQLAALRAAVRAEAGAPGARRFAVPVAHSALDARARALDALSASDWLDSIGVSSPYIRWWAEYGLRDDYGVGLRDASAWALVHYLAARETDERLEAADGNGWLVRWLVGRLGARVRARALVYDVSPEPRDGGGAAAGASGGATVRYWDSARDESVELRARRVIYAAPRFSAKHVVRGYAPGWLANFSYAPWVVANVGLRAPPAAARPSAWARALAAVGLGRAAGGGGEGSAFGYRACDSVIYSGPGGARAGEAGSGLGYALSTSAALRARVGWARAAWRALWPRASPERRAAVLTHFTALTELEPAAARAWLLTTDWRYWRERVLSELEVAHPDIRRLATRVDVAFLAHAMVRPTVGFMWGEARRLAAAPFASVVHWAHSDMSGLSLVEEAVFWGARAAEAVLLELTGRTTAPL